MRTKTIIDGFKNSQKFRFILKANSGEDFGMTITVQQMSDQFATTDARVAVWSAMAKLAMDRGHAKANNKPQPTGLVVAAQGFRQVQVDLS
jgi:hypothetical protein